MIDLAAFVPRLAAELATESGSTWTNVDGSMLSADISGFTALSEKLAGKGKAGAEEITELINTCFAALIDAAYGYGGEIIKFGGDALLVLFRGRRPRPALRQRRPRNADRPPLLPHRQAGQPHDDGRRLTRSVRCVLGRQRLSRTADHRTGSFTGHPP